MVMHYNLCILLITVHLNSYFEKQSEYTLPTRAQIANGFLLNSGSCDACAKIIEDPADTLVNRG